MTKDWPGLEYPVIQMARSRVKAIQLAGVVMTLVPAGKFAFL